MKLTLPQAHALGAHLASLHRATVITHDEITSAAALIPGADKVVSALLALAPSITLPTPAGSLIALAEVAGDALAYATTVAHEVEHARQRDEVGGAQIAIDYLGSKELRATREANAAAAGMWAHYLLTGEAPEDFAAWSVEKLAGTLYHLDDEHIALGRGILASHVATIRAGLCPPLRVCLETYAWLLVHAPEALVADPRDAAQPTAG